MKPLFYTAGSSPALLHAITLLKEAGISFAERSDLNATHLLLPVPSFSPDGALSGGGLIETILPQLTKDITVIGGNLDHPMLHTHKKIDLLKDDLYLAENAAITAHCTIPYILNHVPFILQDCPILIIGWGRIGKCLAQLLRNMDATVSVAARKSADRAILQAMGYAATSTDNLNTAPYKVIINTAPAPVLQCNTDALYIDLASSPGITGANVIRALRLPGKDAPESSGQCIARSVLRLIKQGESI